MARAGAGLNRAGRQAANTSSKAKAFGYFATKVLTMRQLNAINFAALRVVLGAIQPNGHQFFNLTRWTS
jgi:hypothetical protein